NRIVRLSKLEHQQLPARRGDASHFVQPGLPVRKVAQTIADGDDVKGIIAEGESTRIPQQKAGRRRHFGFEFGRGAVLLFGDFEHRRAKIEADNTRSLTRQSESQVACPTTNIESGSTRRGARQMNQPALPVTMQTKALDIVDEVIARCNPAEKSANASCPA